MYKFEPEELNREKSLLDVYAFARRFRTSRLNIAAATAVAILLASHVYLNWQAPIALTAQARQLVEFGLSFAAAILGFLIAGFTIFVTISKVELFVAMAQIEYESTGVSYLKFNLGAFLVVFIHYMSFVAVALFVKLFASSGALLPSLLSLSSFCAEQRSVIIAMSAGGALIVLGTWLVYLLMLLKSFIFNIYQIVMTVVRWEVESKK